jgi:putative transposase
MRTRYKVANDKCLYFVTSTVVEWIPIFTSEKYYNILINTIKYYQLNNNLEVLAYVILPEHFHLIIRCENLVKTIQLIKMYSAKQIINELKMDNNIGVLEKLHLYKKSYKINSDYQIWQEGFHPQEIIDEKMYEQKVNYIHYNPVKRGLVSEITDWKYSSAGFYFNVVESLIEINV